MSRFDYREELYHQTRSTIGRRPFRLPHRRLRNPLQQKPLLYLQSTPASLQSHTITPYSRPRSLTARLSHTQHSRVLFSVRLALVTLATLQEVAVAGRLDASWMAATGTVLQCAISSAVLAHGNARDFTRVHSQLIQCFLRLAQCYNVRMPGDFRQLQCCKVVIVL